ncbi:MAG TPA: DUF169 domain-containing protein [Methanocella sp.]|nr:DUF169 domain-containing protein [Methanocella sp.]
MAELSIREIGEKLCTAGRLKYRPLCVYGAEAIPAGAVKTSSIDRCIAKAMFTMASGDDASPIYISGEDQDCCMGGRTWLGYIGMHPQLKYFVTTGTKEFRGGAAERLKAAPEIFEKSFRSLGKITPPGKYVLVGPCAEMKNDPGARSVLCFGDGEQVRNLAALAHFTEAELFTAALAPWGPTCATFITYPAGMAEKAPERAVFLGPTDPTGNVWFPPELMAMGIPIAKARQMADSMDESFIVKRAKVAYPERRLEPIKIKKE